MTVELLLTLDLLENMVSTPTLRSVAPSRSSGNVGMAIERRVLVFTSDWHFKPAGVDLLHAQLQSLLADPHVVS